MKKMKIKLVTEGVCSACKEPATRELDGILYCGHCADPKLLVQIKRCIEAVSDAVVTIKVMPKGAMKGTNSETKKGY
jgi:predicted amidophosphoribosyltransferase